jgi:hypothetical protein
MHAIHSENSSFVIRHSDFVHSPPPKQGTYVAKNDVSRHKSFATKVRVL